MYFLAQRGAYLVGQPRRRRAAPVGAGCRNRTPECRSHTSGNGMIGDPDRHAVASPKQPTVEVASGIEYERQRTWPEVISKAPSQRRHPTNIRHHLVESRRNHGNGQIRRPPLGLKHAIDSLSLTWVGGEPVNGIGGVRDEQTGIKRPRRRVEGVRGGRDDIDLQLDRSTMSHAGTIAEAIQTNETDATESAASAAAGRRPRRQDQASPSPEKASETRR